MKLNSFLLALMTLSLGVAAIEPASAQEGPRNRGMRFDFGVNRYKLEGDVTPRPSTYNGPIGTVSRGSVPTSGGYLGVNPAILKKRTPAPQPMVATNLFPQIVPQQTTAFNPAFGKPMQPMTASPSAMTAPQLPAAKSTSQPRRSSENVNGRLRTPIKPQYIARTANAGRLNKPAIQSYGNTGFAPGSIVPQSSGFSGAGGASTSVSGTIVRH